ncbi:hypothetical protein CP533_3568 [Ophiocordyceps camponoti-saundersi (nom. inval.)]|nr:hypothetical protein CP533_3568 [Ophiocordyceps camponoti-saundersi (nom. inval.)]
MAPARLLLPSDSMFLQDSPSSSPSPERDKSSSLQVDDAPDTTQLPFDNLTDLKQTPRLADIIVMPVRADRSSRRVRRAAAPPEEGSLCALLRRHPGISLFVRPVGWTDRHSEYLDARFHELPPCELPRPVNVAGSRPPRGFLRPSPTITALSTALTEILRPTSRHAVVNTNAVHTVLSTLWPAAFRKPLFHPELHLFYGDRAYLRAVRTPILWNFPSSSLAAHDTLDLPMIGYIGKNHLSMMRQTAPRVTTASNDNDPVLRLQLVRSKSLMPANPNHDSHFVAIFLAMAQRHFYPLLAPSPKKEAQWWSSSAGRSLRPDFKDVKLRLLTHDEATGEFIVYTARVTAKFLQKFHRPRETPLDADGNAVGLDMEYTRIPIWPILGLRERLGKALGQDMVGSFDTTNMETWDEEEEIQGRAKAKRKRTFVMSEETTDDEGLVIKRRRLVENSPVGVVA